MALAPCRECGKDISTQARSCPHCGIPHPAPKKTNLIPILVAAGVVAFIVGAVIGEPDPPATAAASPAASAAGDAAGAAASPADTDTGPITYDPAKAQRKALQDNINQNIDAVAYEVQDCAAKMTKIELDEGVTDRKTILDYAARSCGANFVPLAVRMGGWSQDQAVAYLHNIVETALAANISAGQ